MSELDPIQDFLPDCEVCGHPIDTENEDYMERYWLTEYPQMKVRPVYFHELCAAEQEMAEIDQLKQEVME